MQCIRHFIGFVGVETNELVGCHLNMIFLDDTYKHDLGKHAASARAWLREAISERKHFILACDFAICSQYQNVADFPRFSPEKSEAGRP